MTDRVHLTPTDAQTLREISATLSQGNEPERVEGALKSTSLEVRLALLEAVAPDMHQLCHELITSGVGDGVDLIILALTDQIGIFKSTINALLIPEASNQEKMITLLSKLPQDSNPQYASSLSHAIDTLNYDECIFILSALNNFEEQDFAGEVNILRIQIKAKESAMSRTRKHTEPNFFLNALRTSVGMQRVQVNLKTTSTSAPTSGRLEKGRFKYVPTSQGSDGWLG